MAVDGELALADHHRPAGVGQQPGVVALVVVERDGQRDQHGRLAGHGELADRAGAGAADHQVGRAQPGGHVAEEGRELGLHHRRRHRAAGRCSMDSGRVCCWTFSRRPQLLGQPGDGGSGGQFGQQARALAAAGDQEVDRAVSAGGA